VWTNPRSPTYSQPSETGNIGGTNSASATGQPGFAYLDEIRKRITRGGRMARNEALSRARDPILSGNAVPTAAIVAATNFI